MTSGEILAPLFLVAVGACLYLAGLWEHHRVMKWKARRDAERAAEQVAAE